VAKEVAGAPARSPNRCLLVLCLVLCAAVAGSGGTARAADPHAFDAELSLTGGCSTSEADPISDPGCPGGLHPPVGAFATPKSVATDRYGDIFVASFGSTAGSGRVDVFNSSGFYLSELAVPTGPLSTAVDGKGNLYVFDAKGEVLRYRPSVYEPGIGKVEYEPSSIFVAQGISGALMGVAVNPVDDHLFVHLGTRVQEFGAAPAGTEPNEPLDTIGEGVLSNSNGLGIAIDAAHNRIYGSDFQSSPAGAVVRIFNLQAPHALLGTIGGATTPEGKFLANTLSVADDEETGHVFVFDGEGANVVYEFTQAGQYLSTIDHDFRSTFGNQISVDNGVESPNGALNPDGRFLFVPSHPSGVGHSFAFGPAPAQCPAEVLEPAFSEVTEGDAQLEATINPCNLDTTYRFEYTTKPRFEEEGFADASPAGEGHISPSNVSVKVTAAAAGLAPETAYRFRVVAVNSAGEGSAEDEFTTYPLDPTAPCPNDTLRSGLSAPLPDCRAFELVTPGSTNARSPMGVDHLGVYFATRETSPAGDKVSFQIEGGLVPGSEGTGSYGGDPYLSTRGEDGWSTAQAGPNGEESSALLPGSTSPDQGFSFWTTGGGGGTAVTVPGGENTYVRYPDGHSEPVGRGSLTEDPEAEGKLISENGGHIVFLSGNFSRFGSFHQAVRLEEAAPPNGTQAIYDRTADEATHVVSLLPGDVTPAAGENAFFEGASLDGKGVAFRLGGASPAGPLYFRYDNSKTFKFGAKAIIAGFGAEAGRFFYLEGGDLYAFDVATEGAIRFTKGGDATVVNVAADGTTAYFVSPSVLTSKLNPNGAKAKAGEYNLYRSKEGTLSFVGVLREEDVKESPDTGLGLGQWAPHVVSYGEAAEDPSRTTPDGSVLLFESRADLTGYTAGGHVEIYRYDSTSDGLTCLSCNPTQAPATGHASLESVARTKGEPEPFGFFAFVNNLRADGRRVFFQSTEPLVASDTDGLQDVYEWEAAGVGSCTRPVGCVFLISSGHSARVDYLYAVSDSGDDAFFLTSDLLLPADAETTPSIYDARVGGGFAEPFEGTCQGEACRPGLPLAPTLETSQTGASKATRHPCRKGTRKGRRHGKVRCTKKKRHHKHHRHKSSAGKGAGR
jgi:hypothetical protein